MASLPPMLAVTVGAPGGVEQLGLGQVPSPVLGPHDVRIAVQAAGLNRADLLQRRGLYPPPQGAPEVLGLECSGRISEVGSSVPSSRVGERVMALLSGGGYASEAVIHEGLTLRIPERLSFEQAAAVPEAFLTAQEALFQLGQLQAGQWVLVHAAAGGVGSAAVQLARAAGGRVIATASSEQKLELARRLGAEVAHNYKTDGPFADRVLEATAGRGAHLCLDFVGAAYAAQHLECLAEGARWIVLGLLGGRKAQLDLARVLSRRLQILGLVMRTRSLVDRLAIVERFRARWLEALAEGRLEPVVDRTYPLEQVQQSHLRLENNENLGKVLLRLPRPQA